jgi:hypothetical protein
MTTRLSGSKTYFLPFNNGCGKSSNSIAWLAHRLSSLYDEQKTIDLSGPNEFVAQDRNKGTPNTSRRDDYGVIRYRGLC